MAITWPHLIWNMWQSHQSIIIYLTKEVRSSSTWSHVCFQEWIDVNLILKSPIFQGQIAYLKSKMINSGINLDKMTLQNLILLVTCKNVFGLDTSKTYQSYYWVFFVVKSSKITSKLNIVYHPLSHFSRLVSWNVVDSLTWF